MSQKQTSPELTKFLALGREYFQLARQLNLRGCASVLFEAKVLVAEMVTKGMTYDKLRDEMLGQDPFMEQVKMIFQKVHEERGTKEKSDPAILITLSQFMDAFVTVRGTIGGADLTDKHAIDIACALGFKAAIEAPKPKLEVVP
jgi:hypothetical protein